ncbi:amino acid adenylation domain-containing protein [Streptomyces alboniger]|uniref:Amino acid adenylation domain-containing protein n=1 Tax=Streptomyces alboniger TaxID=132473 RepID=A0A5J6HUD7_STRAD|nr:amino acid adenylation domain-containing protein [Streptomyces alboniger]QEV21940.1 amino acid adenylation domain-containing protein [Streptomyces alboniger]
MPTLPPDPAPTLPSHLVASLPQAFRAQAARTPHAVAARSPDLLLTYRDLDDLSDRLASTLLRTGVGTETPVAVLQGHTPLLVASLLAILKAGCTYVPLHPGYPVDRMRKVLSESGTRRLLVDSHYRGLLASDGLYVLDVDADDWRSAPVVSRDLPFAESQLAYVMYTSGSTGEPKGIEVTHRNVLDLALDTCWHGDARRKVLFHAPYAFDISTYEVWVPLLAGGEIVLPPGGQVDGGRLPQLIAGSGATAVHLTAGLFRVVAEEAPSCLKGVKEVLTGGDVVAADAVRRVLDVCPGITVRVLYGPTEVTLCAMQHEIRSPADIGDVVPLGRPLDGTDVYVLDADLQPVPEGGTGELCVAGAGVARGYAGRPDDTAAAFVRDPFGPPGARMYRTGDLARREAGGEIVFAGRADEQVKVRGFRVEPGEVEAALRSHPDVADCVVVALDGSGDKRLVAYVVASGGAAPPTDLVRAQLATSLPDYMIPADIVAVDRLPLTPNGKIDRGRLPEAHVRSTAADGPVSPTGRVIGELVAQVLGLEHVGVHEDFFDLGGTSLLAIQLLTRIRAVFGPELELSVMFSRPTADGLARLVDSHAEHGGRESLGILLPIRPGGTRAPLFCVHPGFGLSWCYFALSRHLGADQPIYGFQARGTSGPATLPSCVRDMAADYVRLLRAARPVGPYRLLGWSFGAVVAQEMAVQLQELGAEVEFLALLDGYPPQGDRPYAGDEQEMVRGLLTDLGVAGDDLPGGDISPDAFAELLRDTDHGGVLGGGDPGALLRVFRNNQRLVRAYTPRVFDGRILFFSAVRSRSAAGERDRFRSWLPYARHGVDHHGVDCLHQDMLRPLPLRRISAVIREHTLTPADSRTSSSMSGAS